MLAVSEAEERGAGRDERARRRVWSAEAKRRIVAETYEPGASVSIVARRHDLNANMLFTWRRRARTAGPSGAAHGVTFVPAVISAPSVSTASSPKRPPVGRMEIALAGGDRVIVDADVDAAALGRVINVLSRR
jgi:transposase